MIHYNILKREVDTNRQIYEAMLQRVKESGIASAMKSSGVRVVDPAVPPSAPYKPNIPRSAVFGMIGGLCLGAHSCSFASAPTVTCSSLAIRLSTSTCRSLASFRRPRRTGQSGAGSPGRRAAAVTSGARKSGAGHLEPQAVPAGRSLPHDFDVAAVLRAKRHSAAPDRLDQRQPFRGQNHRVHQPCDRAVGNQPARASDRRRYAAAAAAEYFRSGPGSGTGGPAPGQDDRRPDQPGPGRLPDRRSRPVHHAQRPDSRRGFESAALRPATGAACSNCGRNSIPW